MNVMNLAGFPCHVAATARSTLIAPASALEEPGSRIEVSA
jgi:hypothetical protein